MIYPSTNGKADGNELRLRTMESVWLQGKLKMWGRWSAIDISPKATAMFGKLLSKYIVTHDDLSKTLEALRKKGCSTAELDTWISSMLAERRHSSLVFCTDDEGSIMDRVIGSTLYTSPGLLHIIKNRYQKKMSMREIAEESLRHYPGKSFATSRRRVDAWMGMAEVMLYQPMCDAFSLKSKRFRLINEPYDD